MNATAGKIIIDGNAAAAIGCVMAGVTVVTWYPITPSSSLAESFTDYCRRFRLDPETGKPTFAIVQAEDELAAIGMVLGAGWAGARAMTTTSGPGISLMSEFTGLGYYAEIPAVVFDVQRVGPSTGLPTRTMQGDIMSTYNLSHGDARHILLIPASVAECYEMAGEAFNLSERFQTPVFVMMDLDLGMNNWMSDPFPYPEKPFDRGKVLRTNEQIEEHVKKYGGFARYEDVDGDGIPWRTLPGITDHPLAAYFTRGSGHTARATYSESPDDYQNTWTGWLGSSRPRSPVPRPVVSKVGSPPGSHRLRSADFAVEEARASSAGASRSTTPASRAPFPPETSDFVNRHERVYVVDQNRDRQSTSS